MTANSQLHDLGQSLWLDNITRALLTSGTLKKYIDELSVTGLTSNPTIFDKAITGSNDYDAGIKELLGQGFEGEKLFFELAIQDLTQAAGLFSGIHSQTNGVDGWVSLEVSPKLAYDSNTTIEQAKALHAKADCSNLFIKVPGTPEGLPAIEELIYAGVPINVTLLFDSDQYCAAADAYMKGLERRQAEGKDMVVGSVASVFISRWDKGTMDKVGDDLKNKLGIAVAQETYRSYCTTYQSDRWKALEAAGAQPQRLLWASTGTKDPSLPENYYVTALAAPDTVNTMPENTLLAFGESGVVEGPMSVDGGDCDEMIKKFADAGVDKCEFAHQLQVDGAKSFVDSWDQLIGCIQSKASVLQDA